MTRAELTEKLLDIKREKGWSWKYICGEIGGMSPVLITGAVLAEIVENPLPRDRGRIDLHRHPLYYALRNHIVDFLVSRSKTFATDMPDHDPRNVPLVRIGKSELVIASVSESKQTSWPGLSRPSTSL